MVMPGGENYSADAIRTIHARASRFDDTNESCRIPNTYLCAVRLRRCLPPQIGPPNKTAPSNATAAGAQSNVFKKAAEEINCLAASSRRSYGAGKTESELFG